MKKRLLITSIVMMLVVAVALSTATYAWFTSNTSVKANSVLLTAATMSGDAILISRTANNGGLSNEITLAPVEDYTLYPSTPLANTAFTTGFDAGLSEAAFQNLIMDGTGTYVAESINGTTVKSYYTDTFYIYNKGFSAVTLAPVVSIYFDETSATAVDAARSVRIAIIEKKGAAVAEAQNATVDFTGETAAAQLKGIWQYSNNFEYTAVDSEATFNASTNYYTNTADPEEDPEYELAEVTGETFASLKSTLFTRANIAAIGANTGYGVQGAGPYTQGEVSFAGVVNATFQAIAAPAAQTFIANQYTVVVWYEGWDPQCTNAMSAGVIRVGLSFAKA